MGLDQYFTKKTYIGANHDHNEVTGTVEIYVKGEKLPIRFDRISYISEEVGYWRKANAIHGWFVKNVQDGVDNCEEYHVSMEKIKELHSICAEVLYNNKKAEELLPATDGFFFGSTYYDKYYYEDIKYTFNLLGNIITYGEGWRVDYYYNSSW